MKQNLFSCCVYSVHKCRDSSSSVATGFKQQLHFAYTATAPPPPPPPSLKKTLLSQTQPRNSPSERSITYMQHSTPPGTSALWPPPTSERFTPSKSTAVFGKLRVVKTSRQQACSAAEEAGSHVHPFGHSWLYIVNAPHDVSRGSRINLRDGKGTSLLFRSSLPLSLAHRATH